MKKRLFWLFSFILVFTIVFFIWNQDVSEAQTTSPKGIYMFGSIDNNKMTSGYFGKKHDEAIDKNWCVFIGENGKVYKINLIGRSISELYIDGQKIEDSKIWKHTSEYKLFLLKFWRSEEIEQQSREIDWQIKPLDRKIEALNKEIEKLDLAEESLDKDFKRKSSEFDEKRKTLKAQQKRLSELQNELDNKIEGFSKEQEKLSNEQESLNLMEEMDKVLLKISEDLKALGVIKNTEKLSFKLSNLELIVNGRKVSPEVFNLLKARYIFDSKGGESGFLYRWKGDI